MTDDLSGQEVPLEDLPEELRAPPQNQTGQQSALSGQEVPEHDLPDDVRYGTLGQQALTVAENVARGATLGGSTYLEKKLGDWGVPGLTAEDIKGRESANPTEAMLGELGGNIGLMALAPELEFGGSSALAKIGSRALSLGLQSMSMQGGHELAKSFLGEADPGEAVARHIVVAGATGLLLGGAFGTVNVGAQKYLENIGNKLSSAMIGTGYGLKNLGNEVVPLADAAISDIEKSSIDPLWFEHGQKAAQFAHNEALKQTARTAATVIGGQNKGIPGYVAGYLGERLAELGLGKLSSKVVGPLLLNLAAKEGIRSTIATAANYGMSAAKGEGLIARAIDALFASGGSQALNYGIDQHERDKLQDYLDDNGFANQVSAPQPQSFAHGGEISPQQPPLELSNGISDHLPAHNIALAEAKSRVFNYLNSSRPLSPHKLPYDQERKNKLKERDYGRTLDLAIRPLSILKSVKDGTLTPRKMHDFTSMYPELHAVLSRKVMERIVDHVGNDERPSHKTRQALSLFLGNNLDSALSQPVMALAQATFLANQAPQQPQGKKGNKEGLGKLAHNHLTDDQARDMRASKP